MGMTSKEEIALDHTSLSFGKYRGETPSQVAVKDPQYIVWMHDNVVNFPTCSKTLRDSCVGVPKPTQKIPPKSIDHYRDPRPPANPQVFDDYDDDIPF